MGISVKVELNALGAVGTKAVVTRTRFLRSPVVDTYICHAAGPVMGGQWVNVASGIAPKDRLQSVLNEAARAAVNLSGIRH